MRNAFAKRFAAVLMGLGMLAALPVTGASAAEKAFTVNLYGGEHGVYSETYVESLKKTYGEDNVAATATDGGYSAISVKVTGGMDLPALPQGTSTADTNPEVTSKDEAYGVLPGNWIYSGNTTTYVAGDPCMSNYNVTPEFYLCSDTDVQYVLRFLLEGTEQEVAATQYGTAPADAFASGLKVTAPNNLAEYTLNVQATLNNDSNISYADGTFTLTKSGLISADTPLEYVFYYTQNEHVTSTTQYEDGGTTVEYNDVNVAAGGAATVGGATGGAAAGGAAAGGATGGAATGGAGAGAAAGGAGDAGAAAGGDQNAAAEAPQAGGEEAIGDNETPQAGGEESIGDSETPLAESESGGVNVPLVVGGVAAVIVIALIVAMVIRKRRNGAD